MASNVFAERGGVVLDAGGSVTAKRRKKSAPVKSKALVLRTCSADMTSHGHFRWPERGEVSAPDWKPTVACGHGLHGLLWGEGDGSLVSWAADAKWLVVEVDADSVINLDGKVKFPRGVVVFCGDRKSATDYLAAHGGRAIVGGTATAGDSGTATAGDRGTILLRWYDVQTGRFRVAIGYVGENGIRPNTKYRADDTGKLIEAQP